MLATMESIGLAKRKTDTVVKELLRLKRDGVLNPARVVEAAKPKSSPLHECFTWDDSLAAHQHRLWEARMLIRTRVTILEHETTETRVFVSLSTDRGSDGGYRELVAVLGDEDQTEQLLQDALEELEIFRAKYSKLKKLAGIFEALDKVKGR